MNFTPTRFVAGALFAVVLTGALTGCGPITGTPVTSTSPTSSVTPPSPTPAATKTVPTAPTPTAAPAPAAPVSPVAPAPPVADSAGGSVVNSAGAILPDHNRTPGATNPDVTQATISTTICQSGWTATIRPTSSLTTALKKKQLASGYAYNGDTSTADYEEDHLISLELGGSPDAEANLWPEPYATSTGARTKDKIETRLKTLICNGSVSLVEAQQDISTDWYAAYLKYVN